MERNLGHYELWFVSGNANMLLGLFRGKVTYVVRSTVRSNPNTSLE